MYIRVKRLKTTAFLHVEPTDTVASVKAKLHDLLQQPPEAQQLHKDGAALEDSRILADLKVESDDVLVLTLKKPGERGGRGAGVRAVGEHAGPNLPINALQTGRGSRHRSWNMTKRARRTSEGGAALAAHFFVLR